MAQDRLPPLRALKTLEAFHQSGSVTATARALNVSHSAISHQLKQIEDWAGIRLMRRDGRQTALTEAGDSLAQVINESFGAIRHEIDRLTMREKLPVSVAALRFVIPNWLLPEIEAFMAEHPDVSVYVQEHISDQPVSPEPDLLIGFSLDGQVPPGAEPIIPGAAIPVCAPSYQARHAIGGEADLARATLLHDEDMRMWRTWFAAAGLAPQYEGETRRLFFSGSALICDAARQGLGVALCREALIEPYLEKGELVRLSDIRIDNASVYYLALSQHGMNRRAAIALADWLAERNRGRWKPADSRRRRSRQAGAE
ncbi:LysR family transcriptional regulator [Martelella lutilitoris]|uniref:LysR family transcriptional regulator n=1 Tax=Martelella lutilitoris TaxID=2583532 RepID=A0A7T7KN57_9HYPH|nr:LysR substrate-binding domain-containing protein [Martelella lutilitoris]QQM32223.1 LysR family transcriptional regulator [Martelella lutilitoris]